MKAKRYDGIRVRKSSGKVQVVRFAKLAVVLLFTLVFAGVQFGLAARKPGAQPRSLNESLNNYQFQSLDVNHLLQQVNSREAIKLQLQDRSFEITLEPRDLRAPSYVAVESLANGGSRNVERTPVRTYRGSLGPNTEGQARFNFSGGTMDALILTPDEWYFVEPLNRYLPQAQPGDVVVYKRSDIRADALGDCGLVSAEKLVAGIGSLPPVSTIVINGVPTTLSVELATEADFEYVTALGGSSNANSEILNVMNQVEGLYQTELGLTFAVVFQHTWDTASDPYSSTDPSTMLGEFTSYWNTNFSSVNYDMAHMWTGKDMDGSTVGIAWKGITCRKSNSYGVSQRLTGTPAKYILTAHEMGHNFGADHVSPSNPGQSDCGNTIMNASIGTGLTFCQYTRDQINTHVSTHSSCLTSQMTAPTGLAATAVSNSQISLLWQDSNSAITGFKIYRKTGASGSYAQITEVPSSDRTFADTGLSPNTTYFYHIAATTGSSDSPYSNESSATTSGSGLGISGFSPTSGPVATQVTIQGSGFVSITGVQFNGVTATYTVVSPSEISAIVPASATTGPIRVNTVSTADTSASSFNVTSCGYSLNQTGQSFSATGGGGSFSISTGSGCGWTATSGVSWITVTAGTSGTGSGTVSFSVDANTSSAPRSGFINAGGLTFSVTQSGVQLVCDYSLSTTNFQIPGSGGGAQVSVSTPAECNWTATSLSNWINITGANTGSGDGVVSFSILSNPGPGTRSGSLFIAGQTVTVNESFPSTGGNGVETLFVPVVLASGGLNGSYFTSEMMLSNRGSRDAALTLTYRPAFGAGGGTVNDSLKAGLQRVIPNAIDYLRSLGLPIPTTGNQGGTLTVAFAGLLSAADAGVRVRTTTSVTEGRAGLAYSGVGSGQTFTGPLILAGLRQNSQDRANVAIQNSGVPADGAITLRLTVFSGEANNPQSTMLPDEVLEPGAFKQFSAILNSYGFSYTNGYVRVEKRSGAAPFYAYAVINDQSNSDGSFIPPIPESALNGKIQLTLPAVVEANSFSTELIVTNWTSSSKDLLCSFVSSGIQTADSSVSFPIHVLPHEQIILPELVQKLRDWGVAGMGPRGPSLVGPLFVRPASGDLSGIAVSARTSAPGTSGRFGLFYGSTPDGLAASGSAWVYGLVQDSENRSNLALVNTGEADNSPDQFRIELFDGATGDLVATIQNFTVESKAWKQIGSVLAIHAPGTEQGYAKITRVAGNNPFIAYAVINDGAQPGERTGDGTFLSSSP
jgi:hypothetical protein